MFPNSFLTVTRTDESYGIVMIGIFLGIIGEVLLEKAEAHKDQQNQQLMEALKSCNPSTKNTTRNWLADLEPLLENSGSGSSSSNKSSLESLRQVILNLVYLELPVVGALLLVALWVGWMEGWSMVGSLYWLVVTGTTVGFGDYHPTLPATRLFCIFFLPVAVAVMGKLLGRIASAYMDRKVKRQEKEFLSRSLALCDLQVMDTDVNGKVDLAEFLTYMLVALQKVSKDDIREIRNVFDRLDIDKSGVLTIADLKTQAWDMALKDSMKNRYGSSGSSVL
jgi:Ion channel